MLASAGLTTGGGGRATLVLALEAAFGAGPVAAGDQVSFGRVRIWVDNLIGGAQYKVTHPYGYDLFIVDAGGGRGDIRSTEDIGIGAQGDFTGALNSRIGPFLRWDPAIAPAAPAGYIVDPGVDHAVTGSPFNTNFFRVAGPPGSFVGSANLCAIPTLGLNDPDGLSLDDCIETNTFSILGKYAANAGVNATRATYTRTDGNGGTVDVFATSESGQAIQTAPRAASSAIHARSGAPADPPPAILQLRAGRAESPGWFLIQAAEFDPEPLTMENLRVRDVYASERIVQALLELMASEGWLDRSADASYSLTSRGRAMLQRRLERQRHFRCICRYPAPDRF